MNSAFFMLIPAELGEWGLRLIFSLTILWLATGLVVQLLRRSSAALRHRVWALSVLAAIALPALIIGLPSLQLGWIASGPGQAQRDSTSTRSIDGRPVTIPRKQLTGMSREDHREFPDWGAVANDGSAVVPTRYMDSNGTLLNRIGFDNQFVSWWLGVFLVAPAVWRIWQIARAFKTAGHILAESQPIDDPVCHQLLAELGGRLEWRGRLSLRQSTQIQVPIYLEWRSPCIVLPKEWCGWPAETLRAVLAHELSHAVRRDVAWQLLARFVCSIYWFHPLAWVAAWRMRVEQETACDDTVLRVGGKPIAYSRVLLDLASRLSAGTHVTSVATAMASQSGLERRVRSILAVNQSRRPVGRKSGRVLALIVIVTVTMASVISPFSPSITAIHAADSNTEPKPTVADDDHSRANTPAEETAARIDHAPEPARKYPPAMARLFTANHDGSGMKQLDVLPEYTYHGSPRWSPDGKWIAFNVWKHGENHTSGKIAIVNPDGSNSKVLIDGLMPSFSPRSEHIVFSRNAPHQGVWVMSSVDPNKELMRIDENGWGSDWSTDGRIVYTTATGGRGNLAVFDPADKRRSYLFDEKQSPYRQIYWSMAWSPDGRRVAFKGQTASDKYEIGIVDARGEKFGLVHRIDGEVLASLAWSPDGSRVLFCKSCAEREYRSQIFSFSPDGIDPPQLLPGQDSNRTYVDAAFSPDGKKIVVSSFMQPLARVQATRADFPAEKLPARFVASFKDKPPNTNAQRLIETTDPRYVALVDKGLRMYLPAGEEKPDRAGISTKFNIHGDFEMIAVFHSLKVQQPADGWGAGFDLLLQLGTGPKDFILVERKLSGAGQSVFATKHAHVDLDEKYQWKITHHPPNQVAAGKIKVVRKGATVYYLFAEYGTDQYDLFDEKVVGTEDVNLLKFVVCANDRQAGSEVTLEELSIRAEQLPGLEK